MTHLNILTAELAKRPDVRRPRHRGATTSSRFARPVDTSTQLACSAASPCCDQQQQSAGRQHSAKHTSAAPDSRLCPGDTLVQIAARFRCDPSSLRMQRTAGAQQPQRSRAYSRRLLSVRNAPCRGRPSTQRQGGRSCGRQCKASRLEGKPASAQPPRQAAAAACGCRCCRLAGMWLQCTGRYACQKST